MGALKALALLGACDGFRSAAPSRRALTVRAAKGGVRLLEWVPSQQVLVKTARFGWGFAWQTMMRELAPQSDDGAYVRPAPQTGGGELRLDETKTYELYVGNACPWCHRAVLALALRELDAVGITTLEDDAARASRGGWVLPRGSVDPIFGETDLKRIYDAASGGSYAGRCTAPLLLDRGSGAIVSNESGDIVRAVLEFRGGAANDADLRPPALAAAVDAAVDDIYDRVNNGVYRAGFATAQGAYEAADADVHDGLAALDAALAETRWVCGDVVTEADLRLYPTVARFDAAYARLFRVGRKLVRADYPHLERWRGDFAALPGVAGTVDVAAAARSYYASLFPLNPGGLVPVPPAAPPPRPPVDLAANTARFDAHS